MVMCRSINVVHENSQHVVKHWLLASHSIEVVERTYIWHSIYSTLILCRYPYTIDFLIWCHKGGRAFVKRGHCWLRERGGCWLREGGHSSREGRLFIEGPSTWHTGGDCLLREGGGCSWGKEEANHQGKEEAVCWEAILQERPFIERVCSSREEAIHQKRPFIERGRLSRERTFIEGERTLREEAVHWGREETVHWGRGGHSLREGGGCLLRDVAIHWCGGKEEQWISMLGNYMITCWSWNRLVWIAAHDLMLFTHLSPFFHIKHSINIWDTVKIEGVLGKVCASMTSIWWSYNYKTTSLWFHANAWIFTHLLKTFYWLCLTLLFTECPMSHNDKEKILLLFVGCVQRLFLERNH